MQAPKRNWNIDLRVNGVARSLAVEARETLLDVLRERLDLTGSKRGCDRGECGSCTVLVEGKPVYSCQVLAVQARSREITTVEGLASASGLHPLQAAFIACDGGQCGFCTPGFLLCAKALLESNPTPTPQEVREALAGNICRCNAYGRIVASVLEAGRVMRGAV